MQARAGTEMTSSGANMVECGVEAEQAEGLGGERRV
jgi:hypothetical protein